MIKTVKFILIGDVSVGKTSVIQGYISKEFSPVINPTIGLAFNKKSLKVDGEDIELQIWDTAGQEEYRALTKSYFRNSACVIMVFDVTKEKSFKNLDMWLKEVHNNTYEEVTISIAANKSDESEEQWQISEEQI